MSMMAHLDEEIMDRFLKNLTEVCVAVCGTEVCVAVCGSVLQCDAVCCSVLQCVAVCCSWVQKMSLMAHLDEETMDRFLKNHTEMCAAVCCNVW